MLEDVNCWISATPIECLSDPDIECDRGGKEALVYRKWLGAYAIFLSFCVIFISMMTIVHFVLVQKRKSDRHRLRSGNSDTACRLRMSGCFICVKSCLGKVFTAVKEYKCCDESTNKYARANKHGQVMDGNDDSGPPFSDPTANVLSISSDPLPSPQACLAPVEVLATPTKQDPGKNACCGDEENGQYQNGSKPRAPKSRSGTGTDPYKFNTAKVRAAIRRESLIVVKPPPLASLEAEVVGDKDLCSGTAKPLAPPPKSAKGGDSHHSNAAEVHDKSRRNALMALDIQEPNDAERKLSSTGEEDQGRPSTGTIRGSRLLQIACNKGSPQSRTSVTISAFAGNKDNGNDDDENEDGDNNSPNTSAETEAIVQALLYTGCFVLTNVFAVAVRSIQMQGKEIPFALLLLARFFFPLQGFCNIMVYMRPHIISLRRSNPEYSWIKSSVVVFKGGGDNDCAGQSQRINQQPASDADIRRRQKLVERDHNRRMDEIKRKSMVSEDFIAAARQTQEADEENGGIDDSATHTIDEEAFARRSTAANDTCLIEDPPDNQSVYVA